MVPNNLKLYTIIVVSQFIGSVVKARQKQHGNLNRIRSEGKHKKVNEQKRIITQELNDITAK